jgi:large subunit ribosomal protein L17
MQIITLGKRGTYPAWQKTGSFLLAPSLIPKVFETLATRYADRPGGYTRIHKFGRRQGDNAPHAVLELVDGPRDLKFEMAARATGWDVLSNRLKTRSARALVQEGVDGAQEIEQTIERERELDESSSSSKGGELRQRTRWNVRKVLQYRSAEDVKLFREKVREHMVRSPISPFDLLSVCFSRLVRLRLTLPLPPRLFTWRSRVCMCVCRTLSSRGLWL